MSSNVEEGGSRVGVDDSVMYCQNQPTFAGFKDARRPRQVDKKMDFSRKASERNSALPTHRFQSSEMPFRLLSYKTKIIGLCYFNLLSLW